MILPIVGPPKSRSATRSTVAPIRGAIAPDSFSLAPLQLPANAPVPSHPSRDMGTLGLAGFGLAWVATTAAGAIVAGHLMTRQGPSDSGQRSSMDRSECVQPQGPAHSEKSSCEPPLVSVNDLPRVRARSAFPAVASAARPLPVRQTAAAPAPKSAGAWAAAPARTGMSDGRAKAGVASSGSRSLEDWIRGAVSVDSTTGR